MYQLNSDFIIKNQFWCHNTCIIIGNNTTTHFLDKKILQQHLTIGYNDLIHFGIIPNIYIITEPNIMKKYLYIFLKTDSLFVVTPDIYTQFQKYLQSMIQEKRLYVSNNGNYNLYNLQQLFYNPKFQKTDYELKAIHNTIFEYAIPLASFLGFKNIDLISCDHMNITYTPYKSVWKILGNIHNYQYLQYPPLIFEKIVAYCVSCFQITDYSLYPNLGFVTQKYALQYPELIDKKHQQLLLSKWKNDIYSEYWNQKKHKLQHINYYYKDLKKAGILNNSKFSKLSSQLKIQHQNIHSEHAYQDILEFIGL